jgi:hypothetical protein
MNVFFSTLLYPHTQRGRMTPSKYAPDQVAHFLEECQTTLRGLAPELLPFSSDKNGEAAKKYLPMARDRLVLHLQAMNACISQPNIPSALVLLRSTLELSARIAWASGNADGFLRFEAYGRDELLTIVSALATEGATSQIFAGKLEASIAEHLGGKSGALSMPKFFDTVHALMGDGDFFSQGENPSIKVWYALYYRLVSAEVHGALAAADVFTAGDLLLHCAAGTAGAVALYIATIQKMSGFEIDHLVTRLRGAYPIASDFPWK